MNEENRPRHHFIFRFTIKRLNLSEDSRSEAQVRPDVSVATESLAVEESVLDIAGVLSGGATSDCNKLILIMFRNPAAHFTMSSRQYLDKRRTCEVNKDFAIEND